MRNVSQGGMLWLTAAVGGIVAKEPVFSKSVSTPTKGSTGGKGRGGGGCIGSTAWGGGIRGLRSSGDMVATSFVYVVLRITLFRSLPFGNDSDSTGASNVGYFWYKRWWMNCHNQRSFATGIAGHVPCVVPRVPRNVR